MSFTKTNYCITRAEINTKYLLRISVLRHSKIGIRHTLRSHDPAHVIQLSSRNDTMKTVLDHYLKKFVVQYKIVSHV